MGRRSTIEITIEIRSKITSKIRRRITGKIRSRSGSSLVAGRAGRPWRRRHYGT